MTLKTEYKFIHFVKIGDKPKTSIWSCQNNSGDYQIRIVKWNAGWRQYCFFPEPNMVFSKGCMLDIIEFMGLLNREERRSYGQAFPEIGGKP